ncbi:MAG: hypothetical protein DCF16_13865 [Alphaproteobacteria bacterium]|nr:MAG: hypothetical protein DCF16_13865 [Alphaproteobacteria bacterium]
MNLSTRGLARALPLLEHLFLCGHLHHAGDFAVDGFSQLRVITAPTLNSTRERGEGPGFRLIALPALHMVTWRWTGDDYAPAAA